MLFHINRIESTYRFLCAVPNKLLNGIYRNAHEQPQDETFPSIHVLPDRSETDICTYTETGSILLPGDCGTCWSKRGKGLLLHQHKSRNDYISSSLEP